MSAAHCDKCGLPDRSSTGSNEHSAWSFQHMCDPYLVAKRAKENPVGDIQVKCQPASRADVVGFLDVAAINLASRQTIISLLDSDLLAVRIGATFDALVELLDWHATPALGEGHEGRAAHTCWICGEPWPCPTERARDLLAAIRGEEPRG